MDDVLNIIREVAEQLEDPPEIPPDAVIHDEEQINQSAQTPHQMEQFTAGASIHQSELNPVNPPQWNFRQKQDLQLQDLAVREPSAGPPAEPVLQQPVTFRVAPTTPREPSTSPNVEVYEPLRVAGAMATAQLPERFQSSPAEFGQTARIDHRAVTPEMRVSHMVPSDFPVDFQHALQTVDANISVPAMDFDTDPAVSPDYAPLEPLDSSEQVVVNASFEDDSGERNILP
jgi:hypothetical protein